MVMQVGQLMPIVSHLLYCLVSSIQKSKSLLDSAIHTESQKIEIYRKGTPVLARSMVLKNRRHFCTQTPPQNTIRKHGRAGLSHDFENYSVMTLQSSHFMIVRRHVFELYLVENARSPSTKTVFNFETAY
jgi:hypothetical protein